MFRIEKNSLTVHLRQSLVTSTTVQCVPKIIDLFEILLQNEMKNVEHFSNQQLHPSNLKSDKQFPDESEKIKRQKVKRIESSHSDEQQNSSLQIEKIHILANLLNLLQVGGIDSILNMPYVIKFAQLTVKYFFWSLTDKCEYQICAHG